MICYPDIRKRRLATEKTRPGTFGDHDELKAIYCRPLLILVVATTRDSARYQNPIEVFQMQHALCISCANQYLVFQLMQIDDSLCTCL